MKTEKWLKEGKMLESPHGITTKLRMRLGKDSLGER